jgi:hypothetical protein
MSEGRGDGAETVTEALARPEALHRAGRLDDAVALFAALISPWA